MLQFVDAVKRALDSRLGAEAAPGASVGDLRRIEERLGILIPFDLREFYSLMNGASGPTRPDQGGVRLWSLDEWRTVRDVLPGKSWVESSPHANHVIFADHREESWWYASPLSLGDRSVYLVDGTPKFAFVAVHFQAFLLALLADNESIYRCSGGAI